MNDTVYVAICRYDAAPFLRDCPDARLRMIGEGMPRGAGMDLAMALNIEDAVTFLGAQPATVVQQEMQQARCFVQDSVRVARNGNSEGTAMGILEAGAGVRTAFSRGVRWRL